MTPNSLGMCWLSMLHLAGPFINQTVAPEGRTSIFNSNDLNGRITPSIGVSLVATLSSINIRHRPNLARVILHILMDFFK